MVTKTKRVIAMILTGMMAATALAGCTQTTNTTSSSPAGGTESTAASTDEGGSEGGSPSCQMRVL